MRAIDEITRDFEAGVELELPELFALADSIGNWVLDDAEEQEHQRLMAELDALRAEIDELCAGVQ